MTERARELLATYATLSADDQAELAAVILRRGPSGGVSDEALVEIAEELFLAYDAEEAADASRP